MFSTNALLCALIAVASAQKGQFAPAAADYKLQTPYPPPPQLPPSEEVYRLLDVLRAHSGNEQLTAESVQANLNRPSGGHRVAMSAAFHPDTLAARQPAFEPAAPAPPPRDEFVVRDRADEFVVGPVEAMGGPITNPASFFLKGAKFENIATPKCHMMGCDGPFPNDGTLNIAESEPKKGQTCHQTFVPLNSCIDGRGYPVGMSCTICCECGDDFVKEMKKSHGYTVEDLKEQNSQ